VKPKLQFKKVYSLHPYIWYNQAGQSKVYTHQAQPTTQDIIQYKIVFVYHVYTNQMFNIDGKLIDPADWEWAE
jgi:hypothetical protein